jgi:hypothetical protein
MTSLQAQSGNSFVTLRNAAVRLHFSVAFEIYATPALTFVSPGKQTLGSGPKPGRWCYPHISIFSFINADSFRAGIRRVDKLVGKRSKRIRPSSRIPKLLIFFVRHERAQKQLQCDELHLDSIFNGRASSLLMITPSRTRSVHFRSRVWSCRGRLRRDGRRCRVCNC